MLVRLSIRADGKVDMADSRIERVALARHGKPSDDAARRESFEKAVLRAVAAAETIREIGVGDETGEGQ